MQSTMPHAGTGADGAVAPVVPRSSAARLTWLVPALAATMILALLAIVGTTLWLSRDETLRSAHVSTENLVRVLEEQTARTLRAVDGALTGVATVWALVPPEQLPPSEVMHELLRARSATGSYIRSLYVLDARGQMIHDSESRPVRPMAFADREYFTAHRGADIGLYVSPPMQGRLTGRWGMVLSRRLSDPSGRFAGVVVAALEPEQLEKDYAGLEVGRNGVISLRHVSGQLIIRVPHRQDRIGQKLPLTDELLRQIDVAGRASGEWVSTVDQVRRLYSAHPVQGAPLLVFVGLSVDEVLAPWRRSATVYGLASALLVVVIALLSRRLLREQVARERLLTSLKQSESIVRQHRDHLQEMVDARTAQLVRATEAAESASRAKSEFIANVSHELRTPMHAILSFARFGIERTRDGAAPTNKITQYFLRIEQSGGRLLRLLNDLLDLSKLEAGKMVYEMASADVRTLAAEAVAELAEVGRDRDVRVTMLEPVQPCDAFCDAARIGQVLRNLLSNAVKFTPAGREVTVTVERTAFGGDEGGGILLSVVDEGSGIPEAELEVIFDKFVQSSATKSGAGGTGLGLAICREIVQHHGGRIWAANNAGRGASVHVLLPRVPSLSAKAPVGRAQAESVPNGSDAPE